MKANPEKVPCIELDYNFGSDKSDDPEHKVTMLVACDSVHQSLVSPMANKKGGGDDYVVESLLQWIDGLGLVKAEIKCDQEPAAVDLVTALAMRCKSTVLIPMASPKGSKGSLGRGERGHLSVQGQLRTIRAATEKSYEVTVGATHLLMPWMTRHCSWTITRFQPKWTGHTACRSLRGKDYSGGVVPFSEVVLYRVIDDDGDKLKPRWAKGIFVGKTDQTDEFVLLTPKGARKSRSVKRLEAAEAWDREVMAACIGAP